MTSKFQLIKIINQVIKLGARNIHFTLEDNGLILIQLRSGNLMLPYLQITAENYKQILNYIEIHTTFEPFNKEQPQAGILTLNDYQGVLKCSISILPTAEFKSLILRIKTPRIKGENLKRYLVTLSSKLLFK
jgi:type II secretory ATPase GspE/PulE/Tfp pilus assembly ATPase PilB-like protein